MQQGVIAENNETNNLARTTSTLPPVDVDDLQFKLKWNKSAFSVLPKSINVASAAVIDLNRDGVPEIVFSTFESNQYKHGKLRAIRGDSGNEVWTVTNSAYELSGYATLAAGDIDNDGFPEIVAIHEDGYTIAFEHDGTFKWRNYDATWSEANGGASIADLDGDGVPEVIVGNVVMNGLNGSLRWRGSGPGKGVNELGPLSIVADIDLDGRPEVIAGNSAYRYDGTLYWSAAISDGFAGVGNFDTDPYAEVVVVTDGKVYLLEHDGTTKWAQPAAIPGGGRGGAPTIADVNGDGSLEIGVAGAKNYAVFRSDGALLWPPKPVQDASSHITGSSVFDFNGDGAAEVVYGDEVYLRVYRGSDGTVLDAWPKSSGTGVELPMIVDVDGDGKAEIVAVANRVGHHGTLDVGIFVIEDTNDNWVSTRKIWNQHSYHITNVNDDGTIPAYEEPSWLVHNTYRLNAQPGRDPLAAPDLTASYLRAIGTAQEATITARVGNGGMLAVQPGVYVAFYDADPDEGGTLLGRTITTVALNPGEYQDVSIFTPLGGPQDIWVVADDDGTGVGQVREADENNNTHHALLRILGPEIVVTTPADGTEITAGETVVISGTAFVQRPDLGGGSSLANRIVAVLINNSAVEVLDAAGNFFTQVDVLPGENVFDLTAFDAYGQTAATRVTIIGSQAPSGSVDQLFDVSPSFAPLYARTSFEQRSDRLFAELAIHNVGQYPADNPFYVGVRNISDPTVTVREAAGMTGDGIPYYNFSAGRARQLAQSGRCHRFCPGGVPQPQSRAFHVRTGLPGQTQRAAHVYHRADCRDLTPGGHTTTMLMPAIWTAIR